MKAILVTTKHGGVFFGNVEDSQDVTTLSMGLKGARCAIYWGTTGGVAELASTGPTDKSRIGSKADIAVLHDITGVWNVTDEAAAKWNSAK